VERIRGNQTNTTRVRERAKKKNNNIKMATAQNLLLSPAELAYLHSSLSLTPPIRPDGRSATQFRPLTAETGVLPGTNGSARICFADGTEAIVGAKAEVERTRPSFYKDQQQHSNDAASPDRTRTEEEKTQAEAEARGSNEWLDISVEIPGYRDDDSPTVFLSTMLREALLADGGFTRRLRINRRFHWKLYLDVRSMFLPRPS
jgi:exosome complex component RRP42